MNGLRDTLRAVRAAFVFLTALPVGGFPFTAAEWRRSAGHFPLVGAVLGALMATAYVAALPAGALAAAALGVLLGVALTGGLHEDGLADAADALGGGASPAHAREILKDSRVGAWGALAVAASLLLRAALLAGLSASPFVAMILAQTVSRAAPASLLAALPYVTEPARSRSGAVVRAGSAQAATAAAWAGALLVALFAAGLVSAGEVAGVAAAVGIAVSCCGALFRRRLGGVTGDLLGAAQQVSECAVLFVLAWLRGR